MDKIESFTGGWRALSNFWYVPVRYEGIQYPTLEHAFQAAKTTVFEFRIAVCECDTPGEAKAMGKKLKLRPDWEQIKIDVMRTLLRDKFQVPAMRRTLLGTGDAELIEGNTWGDHFWGVCDGIGHNWLGKLLMEVREEIRRELVDGNCS